MEFYFIFMHVSAYTKEPTYMLQNDLISAQFGAMHISDSCASLNFYLCRLSNKNEIFSWETFTANACNDDCIVHILYENISVTIVFSLFDRNNTLTIHKHIIVINYIKIQNIYVGIRGTMFFHTWPKYANLIIYACTLRLEKRNLTHTYASNYNSTRCCGCVFEITKHYFLSV